MYVVKTRVLLRNYCYSDREKTVQRTESYFPWFSYAEYINWSA